MMIGTYSDEMIDQSKVCSSSEVVLRARCARWRVGVSAGRTNLEQHH